MLPCTGTVHQQAVALLLNCITPNTPTLLSTGQFDLNECWLFRSQKQYALTARLHLQYILAVMTVMENLPLCESANQALNSTYRQPIIPALTNIVARIVARIQRPPNNATAPTKNFSAKRQRPIRIQLSASHDTTCPFPVSHRARPIFPASTMPHLFLFIPNNLAFACTHTCRSP